MNRPLAAALTLGAVLWAAMIVAAPHAVAEGRLPVLTAQLYAAASRICHQRPERSFALAGVQMPVCARCWGLYAGGAVGALLAWVVLAQAGTRHTRRVLLLAAIPTAATWSLEAAGFATFSNMSRTVAALPLGVAAGWVLVGMLRYDAELDAGQIHNSGSRARRV